MGGKNFVNEIERRLTVVIGDPRFERFSNKKIMTFQQRSASWISRFFVRSFSLFLLLILCSLYSYIVTSFIFLYYALFDFLSRALSF